MTLFLQIGYFIEFWITHRVLIVPRIISNGSFHRSVGASGGRRDKSIYSCAAGWNPLLGSSLFTK